MQGVLAARTLLRGMLEVFHIIENPLSRIELKVATLNPIVVIKA
jgi:hypothetical protein